MGVAAGGDGVQKGVYEEKESARPFALRAMRYSLFLSTAKRCGLRVCVSARAKKENRVDGREGYREGKQRGKADARLWGLDGRDESHPPHTFDFHPLLSARPPTVDVASPKSDSDCKLAPGRNAHLSRICLSVFRFFFFFFFKVLYDDITFILKNAKNEYILNY